MTDLIDRQTAIETAIEAADRWDGAYSPERERIIRKFFDKVSAVQPDHVADVSKKVDGDCISRQAAIDALARMMPRSYTPDGSHPADEEIFRAQEVFADCIEALEILPSAQPEIIRCKDCKHRYLDGMIWNCPFGLSGGEDFFCGYGTEPYKGNDMDDLISRRAAIETLRAYFVDNFDYYIEDTKWIDEVLGTVPPAQPEQRWIPVTERMPENDNEVLITVWDAEDDYVEVYKGFYQGHEWWTQWCHGCSKIKDEPCGENIVIAWMPLPEPYQGGDSE